MAMNAIMSLNKLLEFIVARTKEISSASSVSLMFFNPDAKILDITFATDCHDETIEKFKLTLGQGIAGKAAETKEIICIEDTSTYPDYVKNEFGDNQPRKMLTLPLVQQGNCFGVLNLERTLNSQNFSTDEITFLQTLGNHAAIAIRNTRTYNELQEQLRKVSIAHEVGNALVSTFDLDMVLELILKCITDVTGAELCSIMLLDEETKELRIKVARGLSEDVIRSTVLKIGEGISGWVAQEGKPLLIKDIENDTRFGKKSMSKYGSKSLLSVPLLCKDKVIGVVNVNNRSFSKVFTYSELNLLTLFANQAAIAIENARLYKELEIMALTDGVTGIYNHRAFQTRLEEEISRADRYNYSVSIVIIDLDFFKKINDTYGHLEGDNVLREIGVMLNRTVRKMDFVARYGGEEFSIVLPRTTKAVAQEISERIRRTFERSHPIKMDPSATITGSFGVATFPEDTVDIKELIDMADQAMYRAKINGRNKVVVWTPDMKDDPIPKLEESFR